MSDTNKKKILVTLTGGGFRWEAQSLIQGLGNDFEYHFVTNSDSRAGTRNGAPSGEVHIVKKVTTMKHGGTVRKFINLIRSMIDCYALVRRIRPEAIICVGTSIAVPLCLSGKIFGAKTIYVESITRVTHPSRTGTILSRLRLCDRHYVQWPEAEKLYKRALYRGTVL